QLKNILKPEHPGFPANTALVLRFMPRSEKKNIMQALIANPNPPRLLLFTVKNKLTHTVSTKVDALPAIWIFDSLIDNAQSINIDYQNDFHEKYGCSNVCGYIPGKNPDSFIVFSAHFDHLGMMGPDARFAGASDNASGTAFVLELMRYYQKHQPEYNTAFIFFSGEEAGLLGSNYFVQHPLLPLNRIKHLVNIDIMGNAEKGITVVNANIWPTRFEQLQQANKKITVNPRGASNNSDHAPFSKQGVPAFFIYSNGGPGFYHDVFDRPQTCQLKGVKATFRGIIRWINNM
ncbi:MAG: M28 family peptidase, partial [Chitinophagaceae bacterium]|nr:M28 family peptidase [Chitinophagaceae bacterium]